MQHVVWNAVTAVGIALVLGGAGCAGDSPQPSPSTKGASGSNDVSRSTEGMEAALSDARDQTDSFLTVFADCLREKDCGTREADRAQAALTVAVDQVEQFTSAVDRSCVTASRRIVTALELQRTIVGRMRDNAGDADGLAGLPDRMNRATDELAGGLDAFIAGC